MIDIITFVFFGIRISLISFPSRPLIEFERGITMFARVLMTHPQSQSEEEGLHARSEQEGYWGVKAKGFLTDGIEIWKSDQFVVI
jgi:hypothetical protein